LREPGRGCFDADRLSVLHEKSLVKDAHDGVEARLVEFEIGAQLIAVTSQSE
jgi:hypothetical protein